MIMRHLLVPFAIAIHLAFFGSNVEAADTPASFAITHVTVIDVEGGRAIANRTVVVTGKKITAISESDPPKGVRVIDAKGKFLIPGLWDMHVHLAGVSADPKWSRDTLLPLLIANGITGIRDMGGDLDALKHWRSEIEAGRLAGPHIVAAGPMLDRSKTQTADLLPVTSPEEGRKAVKSLKERGADFVKILSRLDRESYLAIADQSKIEGLTFAGHVPDSMNATDASNAGQKSIEHIMYSNLAFDCSAREEELRQKRAEAAAKRDGNAAGQIRNEANASFSQDKADALWRTLIRNKTWLVPTLIGTYAAAHQRDAAAKADEPRLAYLPIALRKKWAREEIEKEVSPAVAEWFGQQFENDLKLCRAMHKAGVQMMAGSDSLDPYNFPGSSLHDELKMLVKAGFTPLEALQAATTNPARFLLGDLAENLMQPGSAANLVLLDANPLDDIANTERISAVIVQGRLFARADLDRLLADARAVAAKAE